MSKKLEMYQLLGKKVKHAYGIGTITEIHAGITDSEQGKLMVTVDFDREKDRKFDLLRHDVISLVDDSIDYQQLRSIYDEAREKAVNKKANFENGAYKRIKTENGTLHYIFDYIPYKYWKICTSDSVERSRLILDYKDRKTLAVRTITELLFKLICLVVEYSKMRNVALIAVPTSKIDKIATTSLSISKIVEMFSENHGLGDRISNKTFYQSKEMIRTRSIDSAHLQPGQNRPELKDHLASMVYKGSNYPDTLYILIDDVFTRGVQMQACKALLMNKGIPENRIEMITVGRTIKHWELSSFQESAF